MEYSCKMILQTVVWLTFFSALSCHPQIIKFPQLDVSLPEEVNGLAREQPFKRAIGRQPSPKNNVEDTIKEVENIIKANPSLPRLTRGEILDLIENITVADKEKLRDPKAIMVVMPYTPDGKNMEDLFTKPPVTHMIGVQPFKPKDETKQTRRKRPPVKLADLDNNLEDIKTSTPRNQVRRRPTTGTSSHYSTKPRPVESDETTTYHPKIKWSQSTPTPSPDYFSRTPTPEVSTYHPKARRPARRRTTAAPTTKHPNHRYPETTEHVPSNGIRIIDSPNLFSPQKINDLSTEDVREEVVYHHRPPIAASLVTTVKPLIEGINLPETFNAVVKDMNLESALTENDKPVESLQEEDIKELLASIEAVSTTTTSSTTTVPDAANVAESLSPDMRDLLMSFGLLPNPNEKPDNPKISEFNPEKAEVKPESYVGFKPLPDDAPSRDDMDVLLASFGLGRNARKEKAVKTDTGRNEGYSFEMVPENLQGVLKDLGLPDRRSKKIRTAPVEKVVEKQHVFNPDKKTTTEEELKKLDKLLGMIRQLEKLNGTATDEDLKKIDLESLKELVGSLNGNRAALVPLDKKPNVLDPNKFDFGTTKNAVKRQESTTASTTTTSTASTTTSAATSSTSTTTEEARMPSLSDLEASFGGQPETATEAQIPETTTTKRTGFYYLVDWNTFLDIDNQAGKRVNLRFQPTIGDPKRFLSVTVP